MIYNGKYTVTNRQTGEHRTFWVQRARDDSKLRGKRILALLTGPDNQNDWTSFAFIAEDTGEVRIWRRFQSGPTGAWEMYARIAEQYIFGLPANLPEGRYDVQESRYCLRCNREITNPASIARGIGPECAEKMGLAA